jgi:biopolymer transport protein ExbD
MSSLLHRARRRRAEREPTTEGARINLVPLVDILTSIVFFSLLTYGGAVSALVAFDVVASPAARTAAPGGGAGAPALAVSVRVDRDRVVVRHDDAEVVIDHAITDASLDRLQAVMRELAARSPAGVSATVLPADDVAYDTVVRVLERLRGADVRPLSLGARPRA